MRWWAEHFAPGREVVQRWLPPARRSALREQPQPERREPGPSLLAVLRPAQSQDRRGDPVEWSASSSRRHREVSPVHRGAWLARLSCLHQEARPRAELPERAQPPAAALRPMVGAAPLPVAREVVPPSDPKAASPEQAQPVASAQRERRPAAEAGVVALPWAQPPEGAVAGEALPLARRPEEAVAAAVLPWVRRPAEVAAEPAPWAQRREAAVVEATPWVRQPEEAAVAEPVPWAQLPEEAAERPAPLARRPVAAERPSAEAPSACRRGQPLPWPARR